MRQRKSSEAGLFRTRPAREGVVRTQVYPRNEVWSSPRYVQLDASKPLGGRRGRDPGGERRVETPDGLDEIICSFANNVR